MIDCFRLYRTFERITPEGYNPEYHPERNTPSEDNISKESELIATMKLSRRKKGKVIIERVVE